MKVNPRSGNNIKPLKGPFAGCFRYRVGDYRVVYAIDDATRTVSVITIAHRREVYGQDYLTGDVNGDGKLDALDSPAGGSARGGIQPFINALLTTPTDPAAVYLADFDPGAPGRRRRPPRHRAFRRRADRSVTRSNPSWRNGLGCRKAESNDTVA